MLDIFGGSNLTGRVAADIGRNWLTFEKQQQYIQTSQLRFLKMDEIRMREDDEQLGIDEFADVTSEDS